MAIATTAAQPLPSWSGPHGRNCCGIRPATWIDNETNAMSQRRADQPQTQGRKRNRREETLAAASGLGFDPFLCGAFKRRPSLH